MKVKRIRLFQAIPGDMTAGAPSRILLCPWGAVKTTNGDFTVNAESAALILARFQARGVDMVIDYEHQTEGGKFSSPDGKAPAAGWVKPGGIEVVEGEGIFANVQWNPRAQQMLAAKEYRYLSPVVMVRKSDNVCADVLSAALTNTPAIKSMRPIVNKRTAGTKEPEMADQKQLDTLQAKIDEQAAELKTLKAFQASVLAKLELKTATDTALDERIVALKTPPADMVPATVLEALQAEVKALKSTGAERDADAFILANARKITTDAEKAWWRTLFLRDRPQAEEGAKALADKVATGAVEPTPTATSNQADRALIIAKAAKEWDGEPQLQKLCSKANHINGELYAANCMRVATTEELAKVGL